MKFALALLLTVVLALGILAYNQHATIATQQGQLAAFASRSSFLDDGARGPSLDLQAKCAEKAKQSFDQSGFKLEDGAVFENHYSTKFKRCFVYVQNIANKAKTIWTYRNVYDAFEGKAYGTYAWHTVDDKKYWEVPPVMCEVISPVGDKQLCLSGEDFTHLIKVYMNAE